VRLSASCVTWVPRTDQLSLLPVAGAFDTGLLGAVRAKRTVMTKSASSVDPNVMIGVVPKFPPSW
jgi:hypothetical protein